MSDTGLQIVRHLSALGKVLPKHLLVAQDLLLTRQALPLEAGFVRVTPEVGPHITSGKKEGTKIGYDPRLKKPRFFLKVKT